MGKVFEIDQSKSKKAGKSKKTKKASETLVQFVLDETGSMDCIRDATIDGFNEYVNGLRKDKKSKYRLALTKFDSTGIEDIFGGFLPLSEFPDLTRDTYSPGALTNLNDAIGSTITRMEAEVGKKKKVNFLVVIMTDGHENASVEWTADMCKDLIKRKEKDGWTVTFLGANMDAQKVSRSYAIKSGNAKTYSVENMGATMSTLSSATRAYACSATLGAASNDFFEGTEDLTTTGDKSVDTTMDPTAKMPKGDAVKLGPAGSVNLTEIASVFSPVSKVEIADLSGQVKPDLTPGGATPMPSLDQAKLQEKLDKEEDTNNG